MTHPSPFRRGPSTLWLLATLAACAPELPAPHHARGSDGEDSAGGLELEPAAPANAAFPVLRLRVRLPPRAGEIDLERVFLIQGQLGPAHLRQIARGELSKALSKRVVPSLAWVDQADQGEAAVVVVAPTVPLAPGEAYTVAGGLPPFSYPIRIMAEGAPPVLARIWPPPGAGATLDLGVWCGDELLPDLATAAELSPGGLRGQLRRGAVDDVGARCVRFEAAQPGADGEGVLVGPPAFEAPAGDALAAADAAGAEDAEDAEEQPIACLDPRPFALEAEPAAVEPAACDAGEVPFGPGCVVVADDRLYGRSAGAPLLWAIAGEGLDVVLATRPRDPFLIAPLPASSSVALQVVTVDAAGGEHRRGFTAWTLEPMPHVVINEVLANPLGPEPAQEWVELYNDGLVTAELGGYSLSDVGGETPLPAALLAPGAYALIVNEAFVEDNELDPPPAPGTLLLRVPKLGKDGLSNAGEPLKLKDESGIVRSRSPASPKPKAGMSLSRITPHAPDGLPGSHATSWPTPGYENIIDQATP